MRELNNQGFETFLPLASVTKVKRGKVSRIVQPLLRGYLFVSFDTKHQRWQAIQSTYGVHSFIGYYPGMKRPLSIRQKEIDELRASVEEHGGYVPLDKRPREIEENMMVRILHGGLKHQIARVKSVKGSRVELLFQFLGSEVTIKLDKNVLVEKDD